MIHKSSKRVKTKSQKVFGANSYVCRSYRGKTEPPLLAILNRVKDTIMDLFKTNVDKNMPKDYEPNKAACALIIIISTAKGKAIKRYQSKKTLQNCKPYLRNMTDDVRTSGE